MLTTRVHGIIDYGVTAMLAGLSSARALPRPVRTVLGAASAFHAAYTPLTDYEGGVRPAITMRQHLALDTAGGLALCAASLLLRRQPAGARALLFAAGAAELGVVAFSSAAPRLGPGQGSGPLARLAGITADPVQSTYPPLDTPKTIADGVFIVDSALPGAIGHVLPARMTVIKLPDGGLLLHSPTRFTPGLRAALEAVGPIRHLVAPNVAHWTFLQAWQRAVPDAVTWAAPGLRTRGQVRRSDLRLDHDLQAAPESWGGVVETVPVDSLGFHEVALFHAPSRTLLLTDLALNLEPPKVPALVRPLAEAFGMTAPDGMPPPYLRAVVKLRRRDAAEAARRMIALGPERVVFAHGAWFETDGTAALQRSFRWLLD